MNNELMTAFINKTIEKTKNNSLKWHVLSEDFHLRPVPADDKASYISPKEACTNSSGSLSSFSQDCFIRDCSYVCSYKTGELLLLAFANPVDMLLSSHPTDIEISLRIQDNQSKYAVEICNTNVGLNLGAQLIRLYNLIDKDVLSVNALIQDFLDS